MTTLHIRTNATGHDSHARVIGQYLLQRLNGSAIVRDLSRYPLPELEASCCLLERDDASLSAGERRNQRMLKTLVSELTLADTLVIEASVDGFQLPAALKQWIDTVRMLGFGLPGEQPEEHSRIQTSIGHAWLIVTGSQEKRCNADFAINHLEQFCRVIGVQSVSVIDGICLQNRASVLHCGRTQIDMALAEYPATA